MNQTVPLSAVAYVPIIAKELMQYKEQIKTSELVTKIRIIRYVKKEHVPITDVARSFDCHRNTIRNIVQAFEKHIARDDQVLLLMPGTQCTEEELTNRYQRMLNKKRIPKTHKKRALKHQEETVVDLFTQKKIRVGSNQMKLTLERRFGEEHELSRLTIGQLKGIYKRNNLKTERVRSANGNRRQLYDYQAIACFQFMHLDVKHILDKKALPEDIYELLSNNGAPIFQWNFMDAKSRTRFMAYSSGLCAEFGFRFLCSSLKMLYPN